MSDDIDLCLLYLHFVFLMLCFVSGLRRKTNKVLSWVHTFPHFTSQLTLMDPVPFNFIHFSLFKISFTTTNPNQFLSSSFTFPIFSLEITCLVFLSWISSVFEGKKYIYYNGISHLITLF